MARIHVLNENPELDDNPQTTIDYTAVPNRAANDIESNVVESNALALPNSENNLVTPLPPAEEEVKDDDDVEETDGTIVALVRGSVINSNAVARRRNSLAENNRKPLALFGKKDGAMLGYNFMTGLQEGREANAQDVLEDQLDYDTVISNAVGLVILSNSALTEVAGLYPWFNSLVEGMLDTRFVMSLPDVNATMLTLTHEEARIIGKKLVNVLWGKKNAAVGVDQWRLGNPAIMEMGERYPFFIPMAVTIGTQQIIGSVRGRGKRVLFGAVLSILDFLTDCNATIIFFNERRYAFAYANLTFMLVSLLFQLVVVFIQNSERGGKVLAFEVLITVSMLKPAFDANRVSSGNVQLESTHFTPATELFVSKLSEVVAEAIPGGCLQAFAISINPDSSRGAYFSVAISCATVAYTSATLGMDMDTDVDSRMTSPGIYGFVPDTGRLEFLLLMFVMSLSHIAMKFLACGLMMSINISGLLLYLAGDISLYLGYKTVRGDLRYWLPIDGGVGALITFGFRVLGKIVVDFTNLTHFRHPIEFGGAYWFANLIANQAFCFVSVYLYSKYSESAEEDRVTSLWILVSVTCAMFVISSLLFFSKMNQDYLWTFFDTRTGKQYVVDLFKEAESDALKFQVFTYHRSHYESIEPELKTWLADNWNGWERDKPEWYTDAAISKIPPELLPVAAGGLLVPSV